MTLEIHTTQDDIQDFVTNSSRPAKFDKKGLPYDKADNLMVNEKHIRTNAFLNREEWEALDATVIARAKLSLNAWADVVGAGLVSTTTLAEWYSKWKVASERIAADVNMDFETQDNEDRTDKKTYGVPIPIISSKFSIGRRELMTARAHGSNVESSEAEEAASAVSEMAEKILFDGDSTQVLQGDSVDGFTSLSARETASADGDFGTLSNVYGTFTSIVDTMHGNRYRGPFNVYLASAQYREMLDYYSDGSGDTGLDRVLRLPEIASVKVNDLVTAGEIVGVQMSQDVVDIREAMSLQVRQWEHPSGDRMHFVVMLAAVPRLKTDYAGNSGIFHISSA